MSRAVPTSKAEKNAGTAGNGAGNGSGPAFPIRTEGQRLLLACGDSVATVARAAGVGSKATVHRWKTGERIPEGEHRRNLKRAYGIPVEAWDCEPEAGDVDGVSEPEAPRSSVPVAEKVPASSADHFLELMQEARAVRVSSKGISALERLRSIEREGALRTQYERARAGERASEGQIIQNHPNWSRFEEKLLKALLTYPDAARAVADVLESA